jgi:hypothetical protein
MGLPIKLTWNLKMVRNKKIAIRLLFASGVVCIMFAILRVAQVAINAAKPEAHAQPLDPTWLAIWGMVECSIGRFNLLLMYMMMLTKVKPSSSAAALPLQYL